MKVQLSELRKFIRESVRQLREEIIPNDDDEIDLAEPTVIWNNTYDLGDHETSTRVANRSITLDPDAADDVESMIKMLPQLHLLKYASDIDITNESSEPKGWEKVIKKMKKDKRKGKNNIDNPWALANWMKKQGYKPHAK